MKRTIAAMLLVLPITACIFSSNKQQSPPPTVESRCKSSCTYFMEGHPCAHEPQGDCEAACVQRLEPFRSNDNCLYCILSKSGWAGHTCQCDSFAGVQTTCEECDYSGTSKGCGSGFSCSSDTTSCSGYESYSPGGAMCASMCGVPEDPPDAAAPDAAPDAAAPDAETDAAPDATPDAATDAALD